MSTSNNKNKIHHNKLPKDIYFNFIRRTLAITSGNWYTLKIRPISRFGLEVCVCGSSCDAMMAFGSGVNNESVSVLFDVFGCFICAAVCFCCCCYPVVRLFLVCFSIFGRNSKHDPHPCSQSHTHTILRRCLRSMLINFRGSVFCAISTTLTASQFSTQHNVSNVKCEIRNKTTVLTFVHNEFLTVICKHCTRDFQQ